MATRAGIEREADVFGVGVSGHGDASAFLIFLVLGVGEGGKRKRRTAAERADVRRTGIRPPRVAVSGTWEGRGKFHVGGAVAGCCFRMTARVFFRLFFCREGPTS